MNDTIIKQMRNIVSDVMTSFQSDFEKYDKLCIEKAEAHQFPMIWIVGTSHTHLLHLGSYKEIFFNSEAVRLNYVQGDNGFDPYLEMFKNDCIFLIEKDKVSKISVEQARNAVRDYVVPAIKKWESLHGALPKKCKVKIKFNNLTISKLKQLIRDCEKHNNTSLIDSLRRFHRYRQVASNHYIQVSYNPHYNEFGFCEYINEKSGLVGGIIFHGWAEIGYGANDSLQLTPQYGWAVHT
ncbi:DUF4120 family protein [Phocaeicola dorei]|jgi:hypothetical protein|uniref:DUF4120 family protein n=1 Tax=Phocaeicola dorei TaxID=357276 RepID=UPI001BDEC188|nr:DUF4120 family protein [Phocaeicola dorei]MBT1285882.1 hypothetical protein [Phocaeicola dorei]MBT1289750.1 hypothetical protein [Phocaeicola dorei]